MVGEVLKDLTVRGEQVERIFLNYKNNKYIVNRRYQRKLIWTIEEKQNFVNSIINGYPVPIVLLAEPIGRVDGALEIIDGMQRLDAITSFISNLFSVDGFYFDLNTFAVTKDLLDKGELIQQTPIMNRDSCLSISTYPIPLSIYEFADDESVNEVFRRINSGGRQLSRQELRASGSLNSFADCVRIISADVRGDASGSNVLPLNAMKKISITNRDLPYGINVEDVFWIKNGILSKENLRQSRDEELVADIVAYMVSDEPVPSRSELLDDYFGVSFPLDGARLERFEAMDQAIRKRSVELVVADFQRVLDILIIIIKEANCSFSSLLFPGSGTGNPIPRYFQSVFLAIHQIVIRDGKKINNVKGVVDKLTDLGKNISNQEGGRWGVENRSSAIEGVYGRIRRYFVKDENADPAKVHWITAFQTLLTSSKTEQPAYDFKQGFLELSKSPKFDMDSFSKILETCAAIANIQKGHKGYVVVGVSDKIKTSERVSELFDVRPIKFEDFQVTGVEHEASFLKKNLDQFFQYISNLIRDSLLSEPLKSYINTHIKCIKYYDKSVFVIEILGQATPSLYNRKYFERNGAQVFEVQPENYPALFSRFS